MYQTDGQVAYVDVAGRSGDAGGTNARAVDTRASIVTRDHMAQVHRTVRAHEAGETATQAGAVARAAVTTRVASEAVGRGAGATDVLGWTGTAVTGDQVRTGTTVLTRPGRTFVYVDLTVATCI